MPFSLDHGFLRTAHPSLAGPYLYKIAVTQEFDTDLVSRELLHAIAIESLPPRVYKRWLGACPDTTAIILGLKQTHSSLIRTAAIRAFCQWFRTAKCTHIWHSIGSTEGIITMLAEFSVNHVREFSKQIGRCSNSLAQRDERQGFVTELMYALASRFFPKSAKVSNPDQRPLQESYARLVCACTPQGRDAWLDKDGLPKLDLAKAMETDTEHYQQRCLAKAAAGDDDLWTYSALLVSLPPGGCEDEPNLPKSTRFATDFLVHLAPRKVETAKEVLELGGAFIKILRRLAHRNISDSTVLKVVSLISRRAKNLVFQHMSTYLSSDLKYEPYLTDIARLWGRDPNAFEPLLSGLLRRSIMIDMDTLLSVLPAVSIDKRYRLFRWLTLHQDSIDIESVGQLSTNYVRIPWNMFGLLQNGKARDLLECFAAIGQSNKWLDGMPRMPVTVLIDTPLDVLRCRLIDDDNTRFRDASERLGVYKRMAEMERDPIVRMGWVNASAVMSVTSGSLDILRDTLLWVRRYNRDPNIVDFYGPGTMLRHPDTVNLLSGIPRIPAKETDLEIIATIIRKGNEIALLLLETAAMCQAEPSFYVNHWSEVQHIFVDIVEDRLVFAKHLQSALALTDAETYRIVWEHTLESLLAAERLGLDERNEALQYNTIGGPLAVWGVHVQVTNPTLSTLRFIDVLAKQRDILWRDHRRSLHPCVTALQPPWPRGLPVQALLPIDIMAKLPRGSLSFIMERARGAVFVSSEDSLRLIPQESDTRAAIGCFVDDYSEALKIYTSCCDKQEKQRRFKQAWQHATTALSNDRFTPLEAKRYWESVFAEVDISLSKSILDYPVRPVPELPQANVQGNIPEWNPNACPHPVVIEERVLEPVCLDCMTTPVCGTGVSEKFIIPKPTISPLIFPDFWDLERFGSVVPPGAEDSFIAAALLLVDTLSKGDSKILSAPFPTDDPRLPAAYLDSDFVDQQRAFKEIPGNILSNTPPALLEQLTASLIAKVSTETNPPATSVRWAFKTLDLLAWSDIPELAVPHIVSVVANMPEHSSWHRVLLHTGVLKRLRKKQTRDLLSGLAVAISEKNKQRAEADVFRKAAVEVSEGQTKPSSTSFVKVTTVKLLAQLLSRSEFVEESLSVDILTRLFRDSNHVDIRVAIVESLVGVASTTNDPKIEEQVLVTLESQIVPVAAQLSGRSLTTEEDWKRCELEGELPEIDSETPIQEALLVYVGHKRKNHSRTRELIQRLLLPLIQQTSANGQRWMTAFFRLNNVAHLASRVPRYIGLWSLLVRFLAEYTDHMPADLFAELHELKIFSYEIPKELQDLKTYSTAGKATMPGYETWLVLKSALTLATAEVAEANGLITPAHLQTHERAVIDKLLENFDQYASNWEVITQRYRSALSHTECSQLRWQTYCGPLVQYMVERVDAMRTPEWQRNPLRRPASLPDVFPLRLWLITYPSMSSISGAEQNVRREKCASGLRGVLEELANSDRPYNVRFALVIKEANICSERERAGLAARLGEINEEQKKRVFSLGELLRVELAASLLKIQYPRDLVDIPGLPEVEEMLGASWSQCVDEDVRERGKQLQSSKKQ